MDDEHDERTGRDMPPRFLVDENAARLVRWLRLMGYDAIFLSGVDDATVVERARQEARILLTRDHGIMARRPVAAGEVRTLLLRSDDTWTQLEQVARAYGLDPRRASFTRCAACNGPLALVPAAEARPFVPSFVADCYAEFMRCAHCGRFYWPGTHRQRVTDRRECPVALSRGEIDAAGLTRYHTECAPLRESSRCPAS